MIKYICDNCKKEVEKEELSTLNLPLICKQVDLCYDCQKDLRRIIKAGYEVSINRFKDPLDTTNRIYHVSVTLKDPYLHKEDEE